MLALYRRLTALVLCLATLTISCGSADTGEKGQEFDHAVEALEQMGTLRYLIATPSDGECTVVASRDDTVQCHRVRRRFCPHTVASSQMRVYRFTATPLVATV